GWRCRRSLPRRAAPSSPPASTPDRAGRPGPHRSRALPHAVHARRSDSSTALPRDARRRAETARARMRTREKNDRPDRCSWTGRIVTSGDSAVQERRASREARLLVPRTTLSAGVTLTTRKAAPPGPCRLAWDEGKALARATSSRHGRFERLPPRRGLRVRR